MNIPVLCLAFNRPKFSQELFTVLKKFGYDEIFLSIDGPRNVQDSNNIKLIIELANEYFSVVHLRLSDINLGVGLGPKSGIDWFFENVEFGIILEDDCIPIPDFFLFVSQMNSLYGLNERVFSINAGAFSRSTEKLSASYYFSSYVNIWGWATWRRVWHMYNFQIRSSEVDKLENEYLWHSDSERKYWISHMRQENITAWDFQLSFLSFISNGINITPKFNLVQNIGFSDSTHIFLREKQKMAKPRSIYVNNKIIHPKTIEINRSLDYLTFLDSRAHSFSRFFDLVATNNIFHLFRYLFFKCKKSLYQ